MDPLQLDLPDWILKKEEGVVRVEEVRGTDESVALEYRHSAEDNVHGILLVDMADLIRATRSPVT